MNNVILKFLNLTERFYLIIYQITIPFILFFTFVLKGASGHKITITNEEVVYSSLLFLAFVLSGFYKERRNFSRKINKVILYLLLFLSIVTFGMSFCFLYFTFTFDYGFSVELIFVFFCFLFATNNIYLV